MPIFLCLLMILPGICRAQNFGGNPANIHWKQINGPGLRIIFPAGLDSQAKRIYAVSLAADSAGKYPLGALARKWNIVLQNQSSVSNAYVRMAPRMSEFYMMPEPNNFSTGSLRWDDNLAIHEQRHIHQFRNFNHGLSKVFSFFLWQEGQLLANGITIPDYFFEGDATWQETWMSPQGRGRMPAFYNGIKALWEADKNYAWMKLRSGSLKDFTPNHYETGYMLVAYGYEKYGADFWQKVTADAVRFKGLFYAINHAIERYSGETYPQFRKNALAYFKAKTLAAANETTGGHENSAALNYITPAQKNIVSSYKFPALAGADSIIVSKSSYRQLNAFYLLTGGQEKQIRIKDISNDDYFSYRSGLIAYIAYSIDAYRANRSYSQVKLLNIHNNKQRTLTRRGRYFSPDISPGGTEVIAVKQEENGSNYLQRLNAENGKIIAALPNPENYVFTQIKYINDHSVVAAVRHPNGKMALLKLDLPSASSTLLTPFTYNLPGYPSVKNDTIIYTMMHRSQDAVADMIFASIVSSGKTFRLTNNEIGLYGAVLQNDGSLLASRFTADGYRLLRIPQEDLLWEETNFAAAGIAFADSSNIHLLQQVNLNNTPPATKYSKAQGLINLHSARPYLSQDEFGYSIYSDNVLSSFSSSLAYVYNRNERSSSISWNAVYAGAFPYFTGTAEYIFNRNIDTSLTSGISFNSAAVSAGIYLPLQIVQGRSYKQIIAAINYNIDQVPYIGIGKNVLGNNAFKYLHGYLQLSNQSQRAKQHINPRWAQSLLLRYRKGLNYFETGKFLASGTLHLPGIGINHSLVINAALQQKDTLPDLFSSNFPFARGYRDLDTRSMYKIGATYHFPLLYPDLGFGNIVFVQRIRAAAFYDHNISRARINGRLSNIKNRSTGAEIYFDGKIWNALDGSIGLRYSHLLDTDLRNSAANGLWEIVLPLNIVPD